MEKLLRILFLSTFIFSFVAFPYPRFAHSAPVEGEEITPEMRFDSYLLTLQSLTKAYRNCVDDIGGAGLLYGPWAKIKTVLGLSKPCRKYENIRAHAGETLLEVALTVRPELSKPDRVKVKNLFPTMNHDKDLYAKKILFTLVSYQWFETQNDSGFKIKDDLKEKTREMMERYYQ